MAAWKTRARARVRQHRRLKPAETTPLTALLLAKIIEECGAAARRRQRRHRRRRRRALRLVMTSATSTRSRSPARRRSASASSVAIAGSKKKPDAGARREGGEHRLRRRAARSGGRRHRQRHLLQPGPRVLRRLAPARAREASHDHGPRAQAPRSRIARSAWAIRSTRTPTSVRSTRAMQLDKIAAARRGRREKEGTRDVPARRASCRRSGFYFAPDDSSPA